MNKKNLFYFPFITSFIAVIIACLYLSKNQVVITKDQRKFRRFNFTKQKIYTISKRQTNKEIEKRQEEEKKITKSYKPSFSFKFTLPDNHEGIKIALKQNLKNKVTRDTEYITNLNIRYFNDKKEEIKSSNLKVLHYVMPEEHSLQKGKYLYKFKGLLIDSKNIYIPTKLSKQIRQMQIDITPPQDQNILNTYLSLKYKERIATTRAMNNWERYPDFRRNTFSYQNNYLDKYFVNKEKIHLGLNKWRTVAPEGNDGYEFNQKIIHVNPYHLTDFVGPGKMKKISLAATKNHNASFPIPYNVKKVNIKITGIFPSIKSTSLTLRHWSKTGKLIKVEEIGSISLPYEFQKSVSGKTLEFISKSPVYVSANDENNYIYTKKMFSPFYAINSYPLLEIETDQKDISQLKINITGDYNQLLKQCPEFKCKFSVNINGKKVNKDFKLDYSKFHNSIRPLLMIAKIQEHFLQLPLNTKYKISFQSKYPLYINISNKISSKPLYERIPYDWTRDYQKEDETPSWLLFRPTKNIDDKILARKTKSPYSSIDFLNKGNFITESIFLNDPNFIVGDYIFEKSLDLSKALIPNKNLFTKIESLKNNFFLFSPKKRDQLRPQVLIIPKDSKTLNLQVNKKTYNFPLNYKMHLYSLSNLEASKTIDIERSNKKEDLYMNYIPTKNGKTMQKRFVQKLKKSNVFSFDKSESIDYLIFKFFKKSKDPGSELIKVKIKSNFEKSKNKVFDLITFQDHEYFLNYTLEKKEILFNNERIEHLGSESFMIKLGDDIKKGKHSLVISCQKCKNSYIAIYKVIETDRPGVLAKGGIFLEDL